jgi:hypothetical protein
LDLLAEYELSGIVQSLAVVKLPQAKTDSIIVSFAEAKVAVVDWDPFSFSLKTVSLHFYENEPNLKVQIHSSHPSCYFWASISDTSHDLDASTVFFFRRLESGGAAAG